MNILILSSGIRCSIVDYFKKTLNQDGIVICTDMSPLAPALYHADRYYIVPPVNAPDYLSTILSICQMEHISGVLSLIDSELSLLAAHESEFAAIGTTVLGSPVELCDMSLNKYEMYCWLKAHGYCCADSYICFSDFMESKPKYPVYIKPIYGSASLNIGVASDEAEARFLFHRRPGMMIQSFQKGQEIGADVYVDRISHKTVSIFTKKKLQMRAGETSKSVSFHSEPLFELISRFVEEAGFLGQIDIDLFEIDGDNYVISEVNPRFGGGYPHAYACGIDFTKMILNNLSGIENPPCIGQYRDNIYMMKYNSAEYMLM